MGRVRFSDNYFDLLPGKSRTFTLRHTGIHALPLHSLRVEAMNGREG
ncbi:glycoside hydrolase family 2 protein [Paenibacillus silvae]